MNIVKNLVSQSKYSVKCPYSMTPEFIVVHNTANEAASTNHTSTPLPKKGAATQAIPQRIMAASGVLCFPNLPNILGIIRDSPIE